MECDMPKPEFLRDLDRSEERKAAKLLFNGQTTVHLEGYVVTLPNFDDLGDHVQMFIMKAIGQGTLRNVLEDLRTDHERLADEEAAAARVELATTMPFPVDTEDR
jgi:hypothetical protein